MTVRWSGPGGGQPPGRASVGALKGADRAEAWLAEVWRRQTYDRRGLRSTSGLQLAIVYPGQPTREMGPDFRDAVVALADGTLLKGDVEIHIDGRDWERHGHHRDAQYNNVVLHVVLHSTAFVLKQNGSPVLTLELNQRVGTSRPAGQLSYVVLPCRKDLPRLGSERVRRVLLELALERFRAKAAAFEGELAAADPEQVLYAGLLEALGYRHNQRPFRRLAGMLPFQVLEGLAWARPPTARSAFITQLLLDVAGLGENQRDLPGELGLTPEPLVWQTAGVRPQNLPARRLRAFGPILVTLIERGILETLILPMPALQAAEPSGRLGPERSRALLQSAFAGLGSQRVDQIAVNVLLPFAAAFGETTYRYLLAEAARDAFLIYPAAGPNQVTSYMRSEVIGRLEGAVRGAAGEQALHQVWDRWCREKLCSLCPLAHQPARRAFSPAGGVESLASP